MLRHMAALSLAQAKRHGFRAQSATKQTQRLQASRLGSAFCACALGLSLWLGSGSARADLAPDPGEPECSVAAAQAEGKTDCTECSAWHGEPDKCNSMATQGYTQSCRSSGASVWHEVWCKGQAAAPPAEAKPTGCGACATSANGPASPLGLVLGLGLLLGAAARRRKRS